MACFCSEWGRLDQPIDDLHHKFCPQYPRKAEENVYQNNCPHCKTPGEQCHKCGAILGMTIEDYEPSVLPQHDNWHVDPEGQ